MGHRRVSRGVALALAALIVVPLGAGLGIYGLSTAQSTASASAGGSEDVPAPPPQTAHTAPSSVPHTQPATTLTARDVLESLPVKGPAPTTGYDRVKDFGTAWLDVDGNRCDTRDDILARDLVDVVKQGSCTVETGTLADPYTGKTIDFTRGVRTSLAVQIDHVVALQNAWVSGAQKLPEKARVALANDPINLLAVDGPTNEAKGSRNAAAWLPPDKASRCNYVARQVSVKAAYDLWVTSSEKAAIARVLATCPNQPAYVSALAAQAGVAAG